MDHAPGPNPHPLLLSRRVQSSDTGTREAVLAVDRVLTDREWPKAGRIDVQIVLAEALNNIVEHAFDGPLRETDGQCSLELRVSGPMLHLRIEDNGRPMPGLKLPNGAMPKPGAHAQDTPEGGFGWGLIHALSHTVHYARQGHRNVLYVAFQCPCRAD